MPQRPSLTDLYGGPTSTSAPAPQRPSLQSLYPTTEGGFDENELASLEKEFGLKKPPPAAAPEPLASPLDMLLKAPKFITDPARRYADWVTDPNNKTAPDWLKGFAGGAAEGVASLFSPANVAATVSGLGGEAAAVRGMTGAASVARGVNIASAVPAAAHGLIGVANDPKDGQNWAELGGGALGLVLGARTGELPHGPAPRAPKPNPWDPLAPGATPEPLTAGSTPNPHEPIVPVGRRPASGRPVNEPLRPQVSLDELYSSPEPLTPGGPVEAGVGTSAAGRRAPTGRPVNEPLRPAVSLDDLYGPEPLTPGGAADPSASFEPVGRRAPADERRAGSPPYQRTPQQLTEDFIFGRGNRGGVAEPQAPLPVPDFSHAEAIMRGRGPAMPETPPDMRPRMPRGTDVAAAQDALQGGRPVDPALRDFFGLSDVPPPAPAAPWPGSEGIRDTRTTMERGMLPPADSPQAKLLEFFGMRGRQPGPPSEPMSTAPAVPQMTAPRLKSLIESGDPLVRLPRLDKLPADWEAELRRMTDELDAQPHVRGEGIDVGAGDARAGAADDGWRDSSSRAMQYPANPDYPNLIQHTAGAPVFHDIMAGRSGTRAQAQSALERLAAGGKQTPLTDRAIEVAQKRLLPNEARDFGSFTQPGPVDVLPTGEGQPRLPGDVGAVRDIEATQPPVAPLPDQSFDLTAPPETQPSQGGLLPSGEPPAPNVRSAGRAPDVDPRVQQLHDWLTSERVKAEAKLAAEGNPLATPDFPMHETAAELEDRIRTADPRELWSKERKLRAIFDSERGREGGFASTAALSHLAGAGMGAVTGAAADPDHPFIGGLAGAAIGGGLAHVGGEMFPAAARSGLARKPLVPPRANLGTLPEGDALSAVQDLVAGHGGAGEPVGGPRHFIGTTGETGAAGVQALSHIAGTGVGAVAGAALDPKHPIEGAIGGAGMGLAASMGLSRIASPGFNALRALEEGPAPSAALRRIMDADAMMPEELRPRAYNTAGGKGTYEGPDIPRGGTFDRRQYPNLAGDAEVQADVDRLTAAGAEKPTGKAKSMPRALDLNLGSDAGFIDPNMAAEGGKKLASGLESLGYFSMLGSPSTIIKGHIGPVAALASRAAEETMAGRPGVAGKMISNAFGSRSRGAYTRALHEGSPDPTATRWGATEGIMGTPSRLMAAPDAWATESMLDAGIPLESAKRSAFTGEPRSHTGQVAIKAQRSLGPVGRTIAFPFARTAINITERGLERTPGIGLLMEMMQKDPSAARDIFARQALGAGAAAGGYALGGDDPRKSPNPYAVAALGPYAVPALAGMALRSLTHRGTASKSPGSEALIELAKNSLSQSPLPTEGYQIDRLLDPRQWPSRFVPRAISMFTDPNAYQTPGPLDPTIARIPFLNDAMLRKKPKPGQVQPIQPPRRIGNR